MEVTAASQNHVIQIEQSYSGPTTTRGCDIPSAKPTGRRLIRTKGIFVLKQCEVVSRPPALIANAENLLPPDVERLK